MKKGCTSSVLLSSHRTEIRVQQDAMTHIRQTYVNKCMPVREKYTHQTICKLQDSLRPICCLNVSQGSWTHNTVGHCVGQKVGKVSSSIQTGHSQRTKRVQRLSQNVLIEWINKKISTQRKKAEFKGISDWVVLFSRKLVWWSKTQAGLIHHMSCMYH